MGNKETENGLQHSDSRDINDKNDNVKKSDISTLFTQKGHSESWEKNLNQTNGIQKIILSLSEKEYNKTPVKVKKSTGKHEKGFTVDYYQNIASYELNFLEPHSTGTAKEINLGIAAEGNKLKDCHNIICSQLDDGFQSKTKQPILHEDIKKVIKANGGSVLNIRIKLEHVLLIFIFFALPYNKEVKDKTAIPDKRSFICDAWNRTLAPSERIPKGYQFLQEDNSRIDRPETKSRSALNDLAFDITPYIVNGGNIMVFPSLNNYFERLQTGSDMTEREQMTYEWLRLLTFSSYNGEGSPIQLARAGFYHSGQNETRCFCCNVSHSDWKSSDNVQEIHKQLSPLCPLSTVGLPSSGNIPVYNRTGDCELEESLASEPFRHNAELHMEERNGQSEGADNHQDPEAVSNASARNIQNSTIAGEILEAGGHMQYGNHRQQINTNSNGSNTRNIGGHSQEVSDQHHSSEQLPSRQNPGRYYEGFVGNRLNQPFQSQIPVTSGLSRCESSATASQYSDRQASSGSVWEPKLAYNRNTEAAPRNNVFNKNKCSDEMDKAVKNDHTSGDNANLGENTAKRKKKCFVGNRLNQPFQSQIPVTSGLSRCESSATASQYSDRQASSGSVWEPKLAYNRNTEAAPRNNVFNKNKCSDEMDKAVKNDHTSGDNANLGENTAKRKKKCKNVTACKSRKGSAPVANERATSLSNNYYDMVGNTFNPQFQSQLPVRSSLSGYESSATARQCIDEQPSLGSMREQQCSDLGVTGDSTRKSKFNRKQSSDKMGKSDKRDYISGDTAKEDEKLSKKKKKREMVTECKSMESPSTIANNGATGSSAGDPGMMGNEFLQPSRSLTQTPVSCGSASTEANPSNDIPNKSKLSDKMDISGKRTSASRDKAKNKRRKDTACKSMRSQSVFADETATYSSNSNAGMMENIWHQPCQSLTQTPSDCCSASTERHNSDCSLDSSSESQVVTSGNKEPNPSNDNPNNGKFSNNTGESGKTTYETGDKPKNKWETDTGAKWKKSQSSGADEAATSSTNSNAGMMENIWHQPCQSLTQTPSDCCSASTERHNSDCSLDSSSESQVVTSGNKEPNPSNDNPNNAKFSNNTGESGKTTYETGDKPKNKWETDTGAKWKKSQSSGADEAATSSTNSNAGNNDHNETAIPIHTRQRRRSDLQESTILVSYFRHHTTDLMTTNVFAGLLEMGFTDNRAREAILIARRLFGRSEVSMEEVLAVMLDVGSAQNDDPPARGNNDHNETAIPIHTRQRRRSDLQESTISVSYFRHHTTDLMTTNVFAGLLEMGFTDNRAREAILIARRLFGRSEVSMEEVLAVMLDVGSAQNDDPPARDNTNGPLERSVTTSLLQMGNSVSGARGTIRTVGRLIGRSEVSLREVIAWLVADESDQEQELPDRDSVGSSQAASYQSLTSDGHAPFAPAEVPQEAAAGNKKYDEPHSDNSSHNQSSTDAYGTGGTHTDEKHKCKICLDTHVRVTFLPCGHLVVCCEDCARTMARCPVCGKRIKGLARTYTS